MSESRQHNSESFTDMSSALYEFGLLRRAVKPPVPSVPNLRNALEGDAKDLRKIRDIQRAQSGCRIVAVAAVVEPVIAIGNRVQWRIRTPVRPTGERKTVEWEVQQSQSAAVQVFA